MYITISEQGRQPVTVNLEQFRKDVISIGRNPECDIVLSSQYVSRLHCCVYRENGKWMFEDLDSRCGLTHRGDRIKQIGITNGTTVRIVNAWGNSPDDCVKILFSLNQAESGSLVAVKQPDKPVHTPDQEGYYKNHSYIGEAQSHNLSMTWYNFLAQAGLILAMIFCIISGIYGLSYMSMDAEPDSSARDVFGDDITDFALDLGQEMNVIGDTDLLPFIKYGNVIGGLGMLLMAVASLYVRSSMLYYKESAIKDVTAYIVMLFVLVAVMMDCIILAIAYDERISYDSYMPYIAVQSLIVAGIGVIVESLNYKYMDKRRYMFY